MKYIVSILILLVFRILIFFRFLFIALFFYLVSSYTTLYFSEEEYKVMFTTSRGEEILINDRKMNIYLREEIYSKVFTYHYKDKFVIKDKELFYKVL